MKAFTSILAVLVLLGLSACRSDEEIFPVATLSGNFSINRGQSASMVVSLDQPAANELQISLLVSGINVNAFSGPSSVTITSGTSGVSFSYIASGAAPSGSAITITLSEGIGYTLGDSKSALIAVAN